MITCLALLACLVRPTADGITLEGIVLAPDGTPAVGARCVISSRNDTPSSRRHRADVFADGLTGEEGCFELRVPESWVRSPLQRPLDLWVWREDLCVEVRSYGAKDVPIGELLKLRTRPPVREKITVLDEEGQPVPGARIIPQYYGGALVPDALAEALTIGTDGRGVAMTGAWDPARIGTLNVESERHGRHSFGGDENWFDERELRLGPVGRLRIEVTGEAPPLPPGLRLSVLAGLFREERSGVTRFGTLDLPLEGEGSQESWPVAAGMLGPRLVLPHALDRVPRITAGPVEAGQTSALQIEWLAGVPASGRVVDAGTGEPVPGVKLWIRSHPLTIPVVSGADGGFEFRALPGGLWILRIDAPAPYIGTNSVYQPPTPVEVDAEAERVELGDIELRRSPGIRGLVVDEAGQPVPGAWVHAAQLQLGQRGGRMTVPLAALTDESGGFALAGVFTDEANVEIAVRLGAARTRSVEKFPVGSEVELVLVDGLLLPLNGSVRDRFGRPLTGATVAIWKAYRAHPFQAEDEILPDGSRLVTDSRGEFSADSCIDPGGSYTLIVTSPEVERYVHRWTSGDELRNGVELGVRRLVPLRGRLLNGDGTPRGRVPLRVTSAFGPTATAVSDAAGHFVLEGVHPDGAFVLAELEGLGLRGRWFGGAQGGDWIVADDEPALQARPRPVTRERELAIASSLAASWVEAAEESDLARALRCLARFDPAATLGLLDRAVIDDRSRDSVRRELVQVLARTDLEEALVVAGSMELGMSSVLGRLAVARQLGPEHGERRLEIIGLALAEARRIEDPAHRLVSLVRAAELLRHLGENETGREILEEGRAIAVLLSPEERSGSARGVFAEELALFELDTALQLIAERPDRSDQSRHYGGVARKLAGVDPEAAEEVYGRIQRGNRARAAPGICYGLARMDLDRARRIADGVSLAPEAYALMARSLAAEEPEVARELLGTAVDRLTERVGNSPYLYYSGCDAALAGSLLPLAEQLAPERVREHFWRALALRWRSPESDPRPDSHHPAPVKDCALACFVARYDPELARALVAPALELVRDRPEQLQLRSGGWRPLFAALVEIDPEWGAELAEELLPRSARGTMANVLLREGEARRQYVLSECLDMSLASSEDL